MNLKRNLASGGSGGGDVYFFVAVVVIGLVLVMVENSVVKLELVSL